MPYANSMSDSDVCAAALFRSRGKDVVTEKEFAMTVSIDLRWLPAKDAPGLVKVLVQDGSVSVKDGYIRPLIDVSAVNVPVTYKLPDSLKARAADWRDAPAPAKAEEEPEAAEKDVFERMTAIASGLGVPVKDFIKECRTISKALGIMPVVAALLLIRDAGIDVSGLADEVERYITSN